MNIRKVTDYYDKILEEFPDLTREEVDKILKHGMRSFYLMTSYGIDILLKHPKYTMYFGELFSNTRSRWHYIKHKYIRKIRVLFRRYGDIYKWDGYYYFGLNEKLAKEYGMLPEQMPLKKPVTVRSVKAVKVLKEVECEPNYNLIYRMYIGKDSGWTMMFRNCELPNAEFIGIIDENLKVKLLCENK